MPRRHTKGQGTARYGPCGFSRGMEVSMWLVGEGEEDSQDCVTNFDENRELGVYQTSSILERS